MNDTCTLTCYGNGCTNTIFIYHSQNLNSNYDTVDSNSIILNQARQELSLSSNIFIQGIDIFKFSNENDYICNLPNSNSLNYAGGFPIPSIVEHKGGNLCCRGRLSCWNRSPHITMIGSENYNYSLYVVVMVVVNLLHKCIQIINHFHI